MSIELIGEKKFIETASKNDGVWVLMQDRNLFLSRVEAGHHLPVWLDAGEATLFAEAEGLTDLAPIFLPLSVFCTRWLAPSDLDIVEIGVSPKQGSPTLTFSIEELYARFRT
jgi:hypothetical protein